MTANVQSLKERVCTSHLVSTNHRLPTLTGQSALAPRVLFVFLLIAALPTPGATSTATTELTFWTAAAFGTLGDGS